MASCLTSTPENSANTDLIRQAKVRSYPWNKQTNSLEIWFLDKNFHSGSIFSIEHATPRYVSPPWYGQGLPDCRPTMIFGILQVFQFFCTTALPLKTHVAEKNESIFGHKFPFWINYHLWTCHATLYFLPLVWPRAARLPPNYDLWHSASIPVFLHHRIAFYRFNFWTKISILDQFSALNMPRHAMFPPFGMAKGCQTAAQLWSLAFCKHSSFSAPPHCLWRHTSPTKEDALE